MNPDLWEDNYEEESPKSPDPDDDGEYDVDDSYEEDWTDY